MHPESEATLPSSYCPDLSVVLPVYNEEDTLPVLYERLSAVMATMQCSYELIFVDDGSSDASFSVLSALHEQDRAVRVLRFSRNFGHHMALTAGLDIACGEAVVMMDSDLQDQPEEIPALLQRLQEGFDVVVAIRQNKKFSWSKRVLSKAFRWLLKHGMNTSFEGGVFRICSRRVIEHVRACREVDRLIIGLVSWVGFRQTTLSVEHGARWAGETKYSFRKQLELGWSALTTFTARPLRLAIWLGVAWGCLALLGSFGILGYTALYAAPSSSVWWGLLFAWGTATQLFCLGIVGEYLRSIFLQTRQRPLYIVQAQLSAPWVSDEDPQHAHLNQDESSIEPTG